MPRLTFLTPLTLGTPRSTHREVRRLRRCKGRRAHGRRAPSVAVRRRVDPPRLSDLPSDVPAKRGEGGGVSERLLMWFRCGRAEVDHFASAPRRSVPRQRGEPTPCGRLRRVAGQAPPQSERQAPNRRAPATRARRAAWQAAARARPASPPRPSSGTFEGNPRHLVSPARAERTATEASPALAGAGLR
jgi:hypothetical protein